MSAPVNFDISNLRAMVSLGPLSPKRFCTYNCAHCYVHADFTKYENFEIPEIMEFLSSRRDEFDIVYVSGDTDSFARPRTQKGINLLRAIAKLNCDVLFTTRSFLQSVEISQIAEISDNLRKNGKLLFGCVSISRLRSAPHVEPKPVPRPEERMGVLKALHDAGLIAVLAIRPFLPVIPADEYGEIIDLCKEFSDVVLGEIWYCDQGGILEDQVLGKGNRLTDNFENREMDFNVNNKLWRCYLGTEAEAHVRRVCEGFSIPFFMRSRSAIEYVRSRYKRDL